MFYNPIYDKVFDAAHNWRFNEDTIKNVSKDEIEVLFLFKGDKRKSVKKYVPWNFNCEQLMEIGMDYFFESNSFSHEPYEFVDISHAIGYDQLHNSKAWFLFIRKEKYSVFGEEKVLDVYWKIRRVILKGKTDNPIRDCSWINIDETEGDFVSIKTILQDITYCCNLPNYLRFKPIHKIMRKGRLSKSLIDIFEGKIHFRPELSNLEFKIGNEYLLEGKFNNGEFIFENIK